MNDITGIMTIASDGMRVERARLEAAAINLANAGSTRAADGTVYQPVRVVAYSRAAGTAEFESHMARGPSYDLVSQAVAPRVMFDPTSPLADANGLVEVSAVNPAVEMVEISAAVRGYEADVRVISAARTMALRALSIGEGS